MPAIVGDLTPPVDPDSRMAARAIQRLERQLGGRLWFLFRPFPPLPLTRIHPVRWWPPTWPRRPRSRAGSGPCTSCCSATRRPWKVWTCGPMPTSWGWTGCAWGSTWTATGCGSGSTPTSTAPWKAAPGGTPTLFVNGRLHVGGYDEATLDPALAAAIKKG